MCTIDLFTISDAVLHAKTYSNVWEKSGVWCSLRKVDILKFPMNYKLKILVKKVNLLNLRSLVSLKIKGRKIKFYFSYIYLCNRSAVHGKFRSICIKKRKVRFLASRLSCTLQIWSSTSFAMHLPFVFVSWMV